MILLLLLAADGEDAPSVGAAVSAALRAARTVHTQPGRRGGRGCWVRSRMMVALFMQSAPMRNGIRLWLLSGAVPWLVAGVAASHLHVDVLVTCLT